MTIPLSPELPARAAERRFWGNVTGASQAMSIASAAINHDGLTLVITNDPTSALRLEEEIRFYSGELPVLHFPDWETLDAEVLEDAPTIVFTVSDLDGNVIRHLEAPAKAGFNRVAWDLRYPVLDPWRPAGEGNQFDRAAGVLVAPGRYRVSMQERIDGVLRDLDQDREFDLVSIREPTLAGTTPYRVFKVKGRIAAASRLHT